MKTTDRLRENTAYEIVSFKGAQDIIDRLIDIGFHPGQKLVYQNQASFHGPKIFRLHNMSVALRDEELKTLELREVSL